MITVICLSLSLSRYHFLELGLFLFRDTVRDRFWSGVDQQKHSLESSQSHSKRSLSVFAVLLARKYNKIWASATEVASEFSNFEHFFGERRNNSIFHRLISLGEFFSFNCCNYLVKCHLSLIWFVLVWFVLFLCVGYLLDNHHHHYIINTAHTLSLWFVIVVVWANKVCDSLLQTIPAPLLTLDISKVFIVFIQFIESIEFMVFIAVSSPTSLALLLFIVFIVFILWLGEPKSFGYFPIWGEIK